MKKFITSLVSLLLCLGLLIPSAAAFTWEAPAQGGTSSGAGYYIDFSGSVSYSSTSGVTIADKGDYTRFTATGSDPYVTLPTPTCASNKMQYVVVIYRTSVTGFPAKFSLYTAYSGVSLSEGRTSLVRRPYEATGEWDAMILDMTDTSGSHTYTTLRMDVLDQPTAGQYVDLKTLIAFPTYEEAAAYEADFDNWDMMNEHYEVDFSTSVSFPTTNQVSAQVVDGKFTRFTSSGNDPFVHLPSTDAVSTDMDWGVILYRTWTHNAQGEFYVHRSDGVSMGQSGSHASWTYAKNDGTWDAMVVDLTGTAASGVSYTNIRLDVVAGVSSGAVIDIASFTCFGTKAEAQAYADSLEGYSSLAPNYTVDFSDSYTTFQNEMNMSHTFVNDQYIRMTSTTGDPNIWLPTPMCDSLDMRYMVAVYRTTTNSNAEFFAHRSDGVSMGSSTNVQWNWSTQDGTWATKVIDIGSICAQDVSFTAFRIDPLTVSGKTVDLRMIAGFATAEDANAYAALYEGYVTLDPAYEADFQQSMTLTHQNQTTLMTVDGKFTRLTATGSDPFIGLPVPDALCRDLQYAVLVYRTTVSGAKGQMYVSRSDGTTWSTTGASRSWSHADTSGAWDAMVVDISSLMAADSTTTLQTLRFDFLANSTSGQWVDMRSLAVFETKEAAEAYAATFSDLRTTDPNYLFDGSNAADVAAIYDAKRVTCTAADEGYLHIECTDSDPYFSLPKPLLSGNQINYLTIFYRNPPASSGQIFTLYDGAYHSINFSWPTASGDGWSKVVVDISSISGGTVYPDVLRLDPMSSTGSMDIRMIAGFATAEDANAFELSDYVWTDTAYVEAGSVAADNEAGTLKYTYNSDDTVTISYTVNGTAYSYTVPNNHNYLSGGYAGTDDLGRSLPSALDVGVYGATGEHYVGLFYFLWMGEHGDSGVYDLQDLLDRGVAADTSQYGPVGAMHWFSEPLYGYYYSNDEWVMRKHMEELTNANIDFLYLDVTNGYYYLDNMLCLMKICHELNEQGYDAPQIVPYTHTNGASVVQSLYDEIYSQGIYSDTWFLEDGKPVIVAPSGSNINNFFTLKYAQWPNDSNYVTNGWPWMDFEWPQRIFTTSNVGDPEAISVSVAQHSGSVQFSDSSIYNTGNNRGRSYDGTLSISATMAAVNNNPDLTKYGLNFQAQWDRAIAADVPYVLVTGWNEWVAQRQAATSTYAIRFVDTASEEYSRDAEMLRGGYFDSYYMQLIANVAKLKGAAPVVVQDNRTNIQVTGDFSQWDSIVVDYNDPSGDVQNRHGHAFGNTYQNDSTGRNDIVNAKVTADTTNVYFYVETAGNITMYNNDSSWMQLFVNTDRNAENGWNGYDYIINYNAKDQNTTTVAKCSTVDGSYGFTVVGEVSYRVSGNQMMIAVPQELLGIDGYKEIYLEFKWADADVKLTSMEDFYTYGDVAPLGRLNNIYQNYIPGVSQVSYVTYSANDTALEAAVAEAESADASLYETATYEAYLAAAAYGTYFIDHPYATQAEVDAATDAINATKAALVEAADKSALQAAVDAAASVTADAYTPTSYAAYAEAVAAGQTVLDDANALQAAVDAATDAIAAAYAALVEAESEAERIEGMTSAKFTTSYVYAGKEANISAVTLRDANIQSIAVFDENGNAVEALAVTEVAYNRRRPTQRSFFVRILMTEPGTHTYTVYGVDSNGNLTADCCTCTITVR